MSIQRCSDRQTTPRLHGLLFLLAVALFHSAPVFSGERAHVGGNQDFSSVHRAFDVRLGVDDPADVVCLLGPAAAAASPVCDPAEPGADIEFVLVFHTEMQVDGKRKTMIFVSFNTVTWKAEDLTIEFSSADGVARPVSWESFVGVFGAPTRLIRQSLKLDEGGIEGTLSNCDDPNGQFVSAVFDDAGLQAFLSGEPGPMAIVTSLRIHQKPGERTKLFPDCQSITE